MALRSPIICVLGHVDHGKTSLLDYIRGTAIASREAGLITQHVGASFVPISAVKEQCKAITKNYNFELKIPGLLFIDTPGHEAFTTLRKRGGSIADLAVVVIDVAQGIQKQTIESIEILKSYKTPFIIAANKIDLIDGWEVHRGQPFFETFNKQRDFVQANLDKKIYEIVGKLGELGFNSDRFDRVQNLTNTVLIMPVSAKTGEGFQELMMMLAGMSQKFMEKKLNVDTEKPASGTILEVKEVKGLGMTVDAIIFEGKISAGAGIAVATRRGPMITKIRAILEPAPMTEIRDPHKTFKSVKEVHAAAGLKISAPGLEDVIPGSPMYVVSGDEEAHKKRIQEELAEILIKSEEKGVIVKADTLGSLEALSSLFSNANIPIRTAEVGAVNHKDVLEADSLRKENRYNGVIFTFNTKVSDEIKLEAHDRNVPLFNSDVIYKLVEDYEAWMKEEQKKEEIERLTKYIYPAKMLFLPGCSFRASKPAVIGVEILDGLIRPEMPLMDKEGKDVGVLQSIEDKGKKLTSARKGDKVAIAIEGCTIGRQINEGDIIFTSVPREQVYELREKLPEKALLEEIRKIRG